MWNVKKKKTVCKSSIFFLSSTEPQNIFSEIKFSRNDSFFSFSQDGPIRRGLATVKLTASNLDDGTHHLKLSQAKQKYLKNPRTATSSGDSDPTR